MSAANQELRLSAQRALLGAISPEIRLIKVSREGRKITFTAIADQALSEDAEEALSVAATEIVADFPESEISEQIIISSEPLPRENINAEGWVFRRRELG